ncbi:PACRG-like protein [Amphiura filiformis]|uniref:PACRG-like protein n=1 Tax=Amphiura filiformis TaxID=82378 RepID=UPI003B215743
MTSSFGRPPPRTGVRAVQSQRGAKPSKPTGQLRASKSAESGLASASGGKGLTPRGSRPSDRLNPKTIDPFKEAKNPKSAFSTVYSNGGVPCRLIHGSVKHSLQWQTNPDDIPFDPVLITLAEGLKEYKHPYQFVAQQGFKELLEVQDAEAKATAILPKIITPLRAALGSPNDTVFLGAMDALVHLSIAVGPQLNPHLKSVLIYLAKKVMDKKHKEKVTVALQQIELHCGKASLVIIKAKIPTYSSVT